jgi:hypothetical protein
MSAESEAKVKKSKREPRSGTSSATPNEQITLRQKTDPPTLLCRSGYAKAMPAEKVVSAFLHKHLFGFEKWNKCCNIAFEKCKYCGILAFEKCKNVFQKKN